MPRQLASITRTSKTKSFSGDSVWPLTDMRRISDIAHDRGLKAPIDGARLLNAAATFAEACLAQEVRVRAIGAHHIRATTHLDVDRAGILRAAQVIRTEAERLSDMRG